MAVIANPYAGRYSENLDELVAIGEELGGSARRALRAALGIAPAQAQSYGKAAIVGDGGELEHAAAILHPKLGAPLRLAVQKGAALVPSAKKMGGIGAAIDVPLGHKDAAYVRSHFDAVEARVRGCAARRRDRGRGRGHRFRPAAATDRRAAGARDQGRGRPALVRHAAARGRNEGALHSWR